MPGTQAHPAPQANGIECYECGDVQLGVDECDRDGDHPVKAVFVTPEPLGTPDDEDVYHHGLEQYVYDAE